MLLEQYLLEIGKGMARLFMNPLFYWILLLFIATGQKRIKKERQQFGRRIFAPFQEVRHTFTLSVICSLLISLLTVSFGIYFNYEMMLLLILVTIILSITASPTFLSASYTLGITFILATLLSFWHLPEFGLSLNFQAFKLHHFVSLAFLMGIFLFIEGLLVTTKKSRSFPAMSLSERGIWIGQHQLKKLAFIPFLILIPASSMPFQLPFFPYFNIGDELYMLALFPFVIGFNYKVRSEIPSIAAKRIGQATLVLSLFVWACAIASLYYPILSFVAILGSILGKEWITYRHKRKDSQKPSLYHPLEKGIKVLAVIPESPADRLGIRIGETVLKVNGRIVVNQNEFYESLQNSGAFFKLDVLDIDGEVRFINSPFYEEDHHALGLVFTEKPYYL